MEQNVFYGQKSRYLAIDAMRGKAPGTGEAILEKLPRLTMMMMMMVPMLPVLREKESAACRILNRSVHHHFPTRTAAAAAVNSSHVYLFMKFPQPQLSFVAAASMLLRLQKQLYLLTKPAIFSLANNVACYLFFAGVGAGTYPHVCVCGCPRNARPTVLDPWTGVEGWLF